MRSTTGPSPRARCAMAYDKNAKTHRALWRRSGRPALCARRHLGMGWSELVCMATTGPAKRYGHAMAYDEARRQVVLFGGGNPGGRFGDTWTWDGAAWTQAASAGPSARADLAMAYDANRQRSFNSAAIHRIMSGNGMAQAGPRSQCPRDCLRPAIAPVMEWPMIQPIEMLCSMEAPRTPEKSGETCCRGMGRNGIRSINLPPILQSRANAMGTLWFMTPPKASCWFMAAALRIISWTICGVGRIPGGQKRPKDRPPGNDSR